MAAAAIAADRPDVVVTQLRLAPASVDAAAAAGVPAVSLLHAYAPFCAVQFRTREALADCDRRCFRCLPIRWKLKYPFVRRSLRLHEASLRRSRLVVSNSRYMQAVLQKFFGLESEVLYPVADMGAIVPREGPHDRILFVKPQYVKGLPILLKTAAAMPEARFLVVGRARRHLVRRFARLGNVEHVDWTDDMPAVYARARVLFAPAIWPEPFGRVFVEAARQGVPSVASDSGGAPEAVGPGGLLVKDLFRTEAWAAALREAMRPERRAALSTAARAHAEHLVSLDAAGRFRELLIRAAGPAADAEPVDGGRPHG
jgi:glycosyltransferase involved in cell wall biosynthesis